MELHSSQQGLLGVMTDESLPETASQPGLTGAWRSLKYQVLLVLPALQHGFQPFLALKAAIVEDVMDAVGNDGA